VQELFNTHLEKSFPELKTTKFLLACSGGIDSVVLAHLCVNANLDFELAHCNFQLRGKESDKDEEFVLDLGLYISKKVYVTNFKTNEYAIINKVSIQVAARELRYDWFAKIQQEKGIKYLVTAHHADDDLETFIINLSRGSGIDGLKGIPCNTDVIKRPLLQFSQEQIMSYAQTNNLKWREDKSNADTKYLRNKIRHQIVPLLKELHPTFLDNFTKSQHYVRETAAIADKALSELKKSLFISENNRYKISIEKLKELHPLKAYLHGLLKPYGFTEWQNVAGLIDAMSGKEIHSKTYRLVKDRGYLLLTAMERTQNKEFVVEEGMETVKAPIVMTIRLVESIEEHPLNTLYVDKETLKYPLIIRKWKKGDYFYPFGMHGKKKLAKFFKDEKIDVLSKESQWLLCSNDQIVWVIGKRSDNRFRITSETKHILKFEVKE